MQNNISPRAINTRFMIYPIIHPSAIRPKKHSRGEHRIVGNPDDKNP